MVFASGEYKIFIVRAGAKVLEACFCGSEAAVTVSVVVAVTVIAVAHLFPKFILASVLKAEAVVPGLVLEQ